MAVWVLVSIGVVLAGVGAPGAGNSVRHGICAVFVTVFQAVTVARMRGDGTEEARQN